MDKNAFRVYDYAASDLKERYSLKSEKTFLYKVWYKWANFAVMHPIFLVSHFRFFLSLHAFKINLLILLVMMSASMLTGCSWHPEPDQYFYQSESVPLTLTEELRSTVEKLGGEIKERNLYHPKNLSIAEAWIFNKFIGLGYTEVRRLPVQVKGKDFGLNNDVTAWNIEAILPGSNPLGGTIVIGAHYDTKVAMASWHDHSPPLPNRMGTPGANDNGSGVAALLSLASQLRNKNLSETIRFVAFINEEPPFYQSDAMGSLVYARMLREQGLKNIRMISLETLGCYSPRPREKRTSIVSLFGLSDVPTYVALLSNFSSREWSESFAKTFSERSRIDVRTLALPTVSHRVAWSDDWSFWQVGVPAFAITDTAFLRHDDYHELNDVPENLDYGAMAEVVWSTGLTIERIAGAVQYR